VPPRLYVKPKEEDGSRAALLNHHDPIRRLSAGLLRRVAVKEVEPTVIDEREWRRLRFVINLLIGPAEHS
jgi:hypothetical protein